MPRIAPWLLTIGAALLAGGCETVRPATTASYAECDKRIAVYGKLRPGFLNLEEWSERDWESLRGTFDKNGDGRVDWAEWSTGLPTPPNLPDRAMYDREQAHLFKTLDRSNKGYIDRADVIRDTTPSFRWQDRNHDGWVSREECALRRAPMELV